MRRQDEIVGVYEDQDEAARHYLLRHLASLPVFADTEQLRKFLDRKLASAVPSLVSALHSTRHSVSSRFLARVLAAHATLADASNDGCARARPGAEASVIPPSCRAEHRLGWAALIRPVARSIADRLEGSDLYLFLGEAGDDSAVPDLEAGLSGPASWAAARGLCRVGSECARVALRNAIMSDTKAGVILEALGNAALDDVLPDEARSFHTRPSEYAQALVGLGERGIGPACRLLESGERFCILHALETLRQISSTAASSAVVALLCRAGDPFIQKACLHTLQSIGDASAAEAVSAVIRSGSDDLKSTAVETLAALRLAPDALREILRPIEKSSHAAVSAAVALAFLGIDKEFVRGRLVDLLCRADPLGRLVGIHMLRHLVSASGLRILDEVLRVEKNPVLRREAFSSLEEYLDLPKVVGTLLEALRSSEPADRLSAARLIAFCGVVQEENSSEISAALGTESNPRIRRWLIRALTRSRRDAGVDLVLESARLGDGEVAGLLDLVPDPGRLEDLVRTGSETVRLGAARALILAGSETGVDALADLAVLQPGGVARMVLEIGGLIDHAAATLPPGLSRLVTGRASPCAQPEVTPRAASENRNRLEDFPVGGGNVLSDETVSQLQTVYPQVPESHEPLSIDLEVLSGPGFRTSVPIEDTAARDVAADAPNEGTPPSTTGRRRIVTDPILSDPTPKPSTRPSGRTRASAGRSDSPPQRAERITGRERRPPVDGAPPPTDSSSGGATSRTTGRPGARARNNVVWTLCANHPEALSIGYCELCNRGFCKDCAKPVQNVKICPDCQRIMIPVAEKQAQEQLQRSRSRSLWQEMSVILRYPFGDPMGFVILSVLVGFFALARSVGMGVQASSFAVILGQGLLMAYAFTALLRVSRGDLKPAMPELSGLDDFVRPLKLSGGAALISIGPLLVALAITPPLTSACLSFKAVANQPKRAPHLRDAPIPRPSPVDTGSAEGESETGENSVDPNQILQQLGDQAQAIQERSGEPEPQSELSDPPVSSPIIGLLLILCGGAWYLAYSPIAFMVAAASQDFWHTLDPRGGVASIRAIGGLYWQGVVLCSGLMLCGWLIRTIVLMIPLAGYFLTGFVDSYVRLSMSCALGLIIHKKAPELGLE